MDVGAHPSTAIAYLSGLDERTRWDLVQSTFALHTSPPGERVEILEQLAQRTRRLVITEFGIERFRDRSPEHATYAAERYERGLREYAHLPMVATGFLLPVLVGQFDPAVNRHTYEQPVSAWILDLRRAGFDRVTTTLVADFWWGPAVLIDAMGQVRS